MKKRVCIEISVQINDPRKLEDYVRNVVHADRENPDEVLETYDDLDAGMVAEALVNMNPDCGVEIQAITTTPFAPTGSVYSAEYFADEMARMHP